MASDRCVVAVLDSDPDTMEMLKTVLELDGFVVATGNLAEFRLGRQDLFYFLSRTQPDVIVYDLGLPYESNWHYLETVQRHPEFARCGLVITTTNERAVENLVTLPVVEIYGKPYDISLLMKAVRQAAASAPPRQAAAEPQDRRKGVDRRHSGDDPLM